MGECITLGYGVTDRCTFLVANSTHLSKDCFWFSEPCYLVNKRSEMNIDFSNKVLKMDLCTNFLAYLPFTYAVSPLYVSLYPLYSPSQASTSLPCASNKMHSRNSGFDPEGSSLL